MHLVKSSERANRNEADEPVSDIGEILEKIESGSLSWSVQSLILSSSERRPSPLARPAGSQPSDDAAHHERSDDGHPAQQPGETNLPRPTLPADLTLSRSRC